ncbi:hypothetical protein SISSUDRAFT_1120791 [Sistotremastrum suecicum HHB10207 ss-3]|uniref:SWR1-complex protein 4 n=1 Tax=Sistotremastrum suecicum HHB10207 ss-3 TaxID=1314776 RepID=A0A166BS83_9AGAM|nr:hypothetical protein SISSUDRAFT_1120791 [Sistotremastrum suecicum HHB10207 ss-3]
MAASAADVRDILSLPGPSNVASTTLKKSSSSIAKKPEGISRELYSLIGNSAPTLTAQFAKPRLKQRPDLGKGKVKWEQQEFSNSARADGLKLKHWVKVGPDNNKEYPFAKYNTTTTTYTYSLDEYTRLLEDPEWTKEETDYLFSIVKEYGMRFYIISDRYDYPGGPPRTIDDLKARYYSICRKLLRTRPWAGDEATRQQLSNSYAFDKEREIMRKDYIDHLLKRTPEQIAEEEALYIELKRLEQTERRFAKEREELLKTLAGIDSGLATISIEDDAANTFFGGLDKIKRSKKRGDTMEIDSPISSAQFSLAPAHSLRKTTTAKQVAQDLQLCIYRFETPAAAPNKAAHVPVHLRSTKPSIPKQNLAPKIYSALEELNINHQTLIMPTRNNLQQQQMLFDATAALIETKRVVDRVDQEIRVLKARLSGRKSEDITDAGGEETQEDAAVESQTQAAEESQAGPEGDAEAEGELDAEGEGEGEAEGEGDGDGEVEPEVEAENEDADGDAEMEDADAEGENEGGDEVDGEVEGEDDGEGDLDDEELEQELEQRGDDEDEDEEAEGEVEEDEGTVDNASEAPESQVGRRRKRGFSTSSVDTSGTMNTRASVKRQRNG